MKSRRDFPHVKEHQRRQGLNRMSVIDGGKTLRARTLLPCLCIQQLHHFAPRSDDVPAVRAVAGALVELYRGKQLFTFGGIVNDQPVLALHNEVLVIGAEAHQP